MTMISLNCSAVRRELQTCNDCFVLLTVKDRDLLYTSELLGEAFLSLHRIPRADSVSAIKDFDQIHLHLSKPTNKGKLLPSNSFQIDDKSNQIKFFRVGMFTHPGEQELGQSCQRFRQEREEKDEWKISQQPERFRADDSRKNGDFQCVTRSHTCFLCKYTKSLSMINYEQAICNTIYDQIKRCSHYYTTPLFK